MKRIRPPAIWKSLTEIPTALKMLAPRNRKISATAPPVIVACRAICWRCSAATPCPSPRKIAASPIGSTATNIGMNACRNFSANCRHRGSVDALR